MQSTLDPDDPENYKGSDRQKLIQYLKDRKENNEQNASNEQNTSNKGDKQTFQATRSDL